MSFKIENINSWLHFLKDVVIIGGIVIAIWGWGIKLTELPLIVDAQAKDITQLKDTATSNKSRLDRLETSLTYIVNDVKEIKDSIRRQEDMLRQHMDASHN